MVGSGTESELFGLQVSSLCATQWLRVNPTTFCLATSQQNFCSQMERGVFSFEAAGGFVDSGVLAGNCFASFCLGGDTVEFRTQPRATTRESRCAPFRQFTLVASQQSRA